MDFSQQLDAIVAKATLAATQNVLNTFDVYWAIIAGFATIVTVGLGFFGYRQISDIRNQIRSEVTAVIRNEIVSDSYVALIKNAVEGSISGEIKAETVRLERQIELGKLQVMSEDIVSGEFSGLAKADRTTLLDKITKLKDDSSITATDEYQRALFTTAMALYTGSEWDGIDQIDRELFNVIRISNSMISLMTAIYGFRLLADVGVVKTTRSTFEKYVQLARDENYLEYALPFAMTLDYYEARPDSANKIQMAFSDISHLDASEKAMFVKIFNTYMSAKELAPSPGFQHYRIVDKFQKFREAYKPQMDNIMAEVASNLPATQNAESVATS